MAEAAASTISVTCSCGKKLKAPASAVGKKAKCPKCGNVLTVAAPPPPPPEDDSLDALYDLAQESEQHAAQQQLAPRCPQCMREMAAGAVLCTNCGYDTRKGRAVTAAPAPAATGTRYDPAAAAAAANASTRKVVDKMAPQGPYWKGALASAGGAAIGAFVWVMIAYATGYWGMLPVLLVAVLAGIGMQWGQEGYSYLGGATAAGITFIVMILARLAVIVALVVPSIRAEARKLARVAEEERMPDLSQYDQRIVQELYNEEYKAQKPAAATPAPAADEDEEEDEAAGDEGDEDTGLSAYEKREAQIYQAVEKKLKAMPKAQYDARVQKLDKDEQAQRLQYYVAEEIMLKQIGVHPERATSVEHDQAERGAKEKIAGMTPAQRDAEYKRLHAQHEKDTAAAQAEFAKEQAARRAARGKAGEDADRARAHAATALGAFVIFMMVFGGIRGGILMLIALGLAYRTASGSISD